MSHRYTHQDDTDRTMQRINLNHAYSEKWLTQKLESWNSRTRVILSLLRTLLENMFIRILVRNRQLKRNDYRILGDASQEKSFKPLVLHQRGGMSAPNVTSGRGAVTQDCKKTHRVCNLQFYARDDRSTTTVSFKIGRKVNGILIMDLFILIAFSILYAFSSISSFKI